MTIAIRRITVGPPILQIQHMILSFMMAKTANVFHRHILSALLNRKKFTSLKTCGPCRVAQISREALLLAAVAAYTLFYFAAYVA